MTSPRYDATPVVGYDDGLILDDGHTPMCVGNSLKYCIDGAWYDVHPYRPDLGGYPVRWIDRAGTLAAFRHHRRVELNIARDMYADLWGERGSPDVDSPESQGREQLLDRIIELEHMLGNGAALCDAWQATREGSA